jgi:ribosomal protein S18 acetylase RimI-like enzyme
MRENVLMEIRMLRSGDEAVVEQLATRVPAHTALLEEPHTIFLVAFEDDTPVGFVLAYELLRRHGKTVTLCVYEVDVLEAYQRRGIGKALLQELARTARERGVPEGFVLTDADNVAAMRLYASVGGERNDVVEWDFDYTDS